MHSYGVSDVEKLLRLSRRTIRTLVAAGFVAPARGPRNALRFSFQDLIVLRTAQALVTARIPQRRIMRALKELRTRLPDTMPISGLSIGAIAEQVVVREGGAHWQAESGQYMLVFEGDPARGALRVIEPAASEATANEDWNARGVALEERDADAAVQAYQRAIAADPSRIDARINLGRLQHERGQLDAAAHTYRTAIEAGARDALLHFNLGVLLEDMERSDDAVRAYESALQEDPDFADAHYNLALLYEELQQPKHALRHMAQYRRLLRGS